MNKNSLLEIASIITNNDKEVLNQLQLCVSNPEQYYIKFQEQYEERGIEQEEDSDILQWIGLTDCLLAHNYSCELDWNCEKEDFFYFLSQLNGIKNNQLPLENNWFDEDDDAVTWFTILNDKWKEKEMCLSALDIDSDSYVIFPVSIKNFHLIENLAEQIDQRIDFAQNM